MKTRTLVGHAYGGAFTRAAPALGPGKRRTRRKTPAFAAVPSTRMAQAAERDARKVTPWACAFAIATVSENAYRRMHPLTRSRVAKPQKEMAHVHTLAALRRKAWPADVHGLSILLTRAAPGNGLDDDNIRGALKYIRDGVALALGLNDKDPRLSWDYAERKTPAGVYFVVVEINRRPPCA